MMGVGGPATANQARLFGHELDVVPNEANLDWNASSTCWASAAIKEFFALRIRCAQVVASSDEARACAIRELIPGAGAKPSTKPIKAAHTEFVAALAGHLPRLIPVVTDAFDLEDRADHLNKVRNKSSAASACAQVRN